MKKKNIILGVTGGVAIYKSCTLARKLIKSGYAVKVVMTPNAAKLVSPLLFESLVNNEVYVEMFKESKDYLIEHISLAKWADLLLIAPASANTIAKLACGLCDNLLTTIALAIPNYKPVLIAPAMNSNMWKNPITQKNISLLSANKQYKIIPPVKGILASLDKGEGVLASLEEILKEVKK